MICSKCNQKLPDDSEFCQYCGEKLVVNINQATPSSFQAERVESAPTTTEEPMLYNKDKKVQYCRCCGKVIDSDTKKCTGCGKQYFKGVKFNKFSISIIILSLFAIGSIIFGITELVSTAKLKDEISVLEQQLTIKENKLDELNKTNLSLQRQLYNNSELVDFIDEYVVFVEDDGTNLYHKYECDRFKGENFWVYNINAAKSQDYKQCSRCR